MCGTDKILVGWAKSQMSWITVLVTEQDPNLLSMFFFFPQPPCVLPVVDHSFNLKALSHRLLLTCQDFFQADGSYVSREANILTHVVSFRSGTPNKELLHPDYKPH